MDLNKKQKLTPFPYQIKGSNFLRKHPRCILADDMGTGKTLQALCALTDRGVVVCPPGLKYSWYDECKLWRPDLKPLVMEGTGLASFKWPNPGELVILGYTQLPEWLHPPPHKCEYSPKNKSLKAKARRAELKKARKDFNVFLASQEQYGANTTLIADEAQSVKNPKSIRSRKFRVLSALCAQTWALTGTPMPRGKAEDFHGILRAMHLDTVIFPNYKKFKFLAGIHDDFQGTPKPGFHDAVKPYMLRRTKSEVSPHLPPKLQKKLTVPLEQSLELLLDDLPNEFVQRIRSSTTARELLRLKILPEFSRFSEARREIARSRIPSMLEFVDIAEDNDQRLLVFSAHREPIEALSTRKGWAVIHGGVSPEKRQDIVRNQKQFCGIGITIKAGGTGLNLASFSNVLFVDKDWDVNNNVQAEDRAHRQGQVSECVNYTTMVSNHPIDVLVLDKLASAAHNITIAIDGKV